MNQVDFVEKAIEGGITGAIVTMFLPGLISGIYTTEIASAYNLGLISGFCVGTLLGLFISALLVNTGRKSTQNEEDEVDGDGE